jgi:hypothetical protein
MVGVGLYVLIAALRSFGRENFIYIYFVWDQNGENGEGYN